MSDSKNKKHLGYEVLGLALFLGGAFFVVSAGMWVSDGGDGGLGGGNLPTDAILSLLAMFGLVPFLAASIGSASLGAAMFLRPAPMSLRLPVTLLATYTAGLSMLFGVFSAAAGGSLGAWLPSAIGGFAGGAAALVLALGIALLGTWLALGMPSLPKLKKAGELNSVAAALREEEVDGVSNAEAAALFPENLPAPVAAPGVREYELRARGELPDGVKPLDAPFHEVEVPQSDLQPGVRESGAAFVVEPAESASRDLAEAEAEAAEPVQGELAEGVWVREEEPELTASPLAPSWEAAALEAEALEPTDAIAEDGERFDEFEVEVPLEPVSELEAETPEFLDEEVEAEQASEEAEVVEGLESAAELDDDDDEEEEEEAEATEIEAELELSEAPEVEGAPAELDEVEEVEEQPEVEAAETEAELELSEADEVEEELEPAAELVDEEEAEKEPEAESEVPEADEVEDDPELAVEEVLEAEATEIEAELEFPEESQLEEVTAELEADEAEHDLGALVDVFDGVEAEPELQAESELAEPTAPVEQRGLFDAHDEALEVSVATQALEEPQAAVELEQVELTPEAPLEKAEEVAVEAAAEEPTVELTREELVYRAGLLFLEEGRVAVSMLQRRFELEFSTATEVLDELQAMGLIGPYLGGSRRDILMDIEAWEASAAAQ